MTKQSSFIFLFLVAWASSVYAVINPALQPDIYYKEYDNVLVLVIDEANPSEAKLNCRISKVIKGDYKKDQTILIEFTGDMAQQVADLSESGVISKGREFPVFAGKPSRRKKNRQLRMYLDYFYVGEVSKIDTWKIGVSDGTEKDTTGQLINTLAGIYCGMTDQLINMIEDMAANKDFYPRKAYVKFKPDTLLDRLGSSVEAIAMYDINGDGMEDILACSPSGDRVYFQLKPMEFTNVTEKVQLSSSSRSCSIADYNCDGLSDLLLDGMLYTGQFKNNEFTFHETEWLVLNEGQGPIDLKSSSFVEINGDGYPDIVISEKGRGLSIYLNPGKAPWVSQNATEALGLNREECGLNGNGYFTHGDWNGDLKTDIFYAHGNGLLLVQKNGTYEPIKHEIDFSFKTGVDQVGQTGAGVFMPSLSADRMDLIVPIEKDWIVVSNHNGTPVDISKWGNEISEGSDLHLATVASDLNLDGYVDIYTISDQKKENRFIINRGYGSYMHSKVHVDEKPLFKGPAHGSGGRAIAVGDLNQDGAPDLLLGNEAGEVLYILNDTLSMRVEKEFMKKDESRLMNTTMAAIRILGPKGVVNARVQLKNEHGQLVARRDIGTNVATGCRSPDLVTLSVREKGDYQLEVKYADGHLVTQKINLNQEILVRVVVQRKDGGNDGW